MLGQVKKKKRRKEKKKKEIKEKKNQKADIYHNPESSHKNFSSLQQNLLALATCTFLSQHMRTANKSCFSASQAFFPLAFFTWTNFTF